MTQKKTHIRLWLNQLARAAPLKPKRRREEKKKAPFYSLWIVLNRRFCLESMCTMLLEMKCVASIELPISNWWSTYTNKSKQRSDLRRVTLVFFHFRSFAYLSPFHLQKHVCLRLWPRCARHLCDQKQPSQLCRSPSSIFLFYPASAEFLCTCFF